MACGARLAQLQQREAEQLVGRALDAGINFIDTANVYSEGRSEEITGQALKNLKIPRENVVVATKVFGETGTAGVNSRGSSRYHIISSVKESLRRLQLDHIDLYHTDLTPRRPSKRRFMRWITWVQHGFTCVISASLTGRYGRLPKRWAFPSVLGWHVLPLCRRITPLPVVTWSASWVPMMQSEGVGLMVWSPLAGGLAGAENMTATTRAKPVDVARSLTFPPVEKERAFDCADVMRTIAESKGVSVAQIVLAWLLHQKVVSSDHWRETGRPAG